MYQNGKIYKLVSDSTDKIYIGSTCNPLYKRLWGHKNDCKNSCITSKEIIKFDDCKIILIEDFPCERKEQLTARERYHIEQNKDICVNKIIPTRTKKEWDEQNKDRIVEYKKEYNEKNKDKRKEYYNQNKDKRKEYYNQNKDKIVERKKEYYNQNKDKAREYYNQNKDKIAERRRLRRLEKKNIEQDIKEDGTAI